MSEFFSHDYNARNDPKIVKLCMDMGYEGIGIYWSILEIFYEQGGYINQSDIKGIAYALRLNDEEKIEKILNNYNLFEKNDEKYFSKSIFDRLKRRKNKSIKAKHSAEKRWEYQSEINDANAMRNLCDGDAKIRDSIEEIIYKKEDRIEEYRDFEKSLLPRWNSFCDKYPSLPKVREITATRRKHLKERFEKNSFRDFDKILLSIEQQPFLIHGNPNSEKHKDWCIDLDWLIKNDTNYVKVLEMKYASKNGYTAKKGVEDMSNLYSEKKGVGEKSNA